MKIRQMQDIAPIEIMPGDSIQLTYRENRVPTVFARMFGEKTEVVEYPLMTETFDEARTIDRIAIVELDGELAALGMSQGIAGVFGKAS